MIAGRSLVPLAGCGHGRRARLRCDPCQGGAQDPCRVLEWEDMDMTTALDDLGVTASTIDDETRERLDRDGYAVLD
jgi:hypothetical protein